MSSVVTDAINAMGDKSDLGAAASGESPQISELSSIPLTQSFHDWWSTSSSMMKPTVFNDDYLKAIMTNVFIEYDLFKALLSDDVEIAKPGETISDKKGKITGEFVDTKVDDCVIHEFYMENNTVEGAPSESLVIIHGYMAAMGYFVKNFEQLIKSKPGLRIHVIDMPGFGNSSRPKFPNELLINHSSRIDSINQILRIEDWFIDKLEAWRLARNLSKFSLIGHSMGAYVCSCYIMKYNKNQINKFIIASPLGTEPSDISLINDKSLHINFHQPGNPLNELITVQNENNDVVANEELVKLWESLGKPRFPKNIILRKIWEWRVSPFQILQCFGPFYSKILSLWSYQRFRNLKVNSSDGDDLLLKLHNYSYSIFNQYQGSGELAITKIINHEILPRLPLADRKFSEFLIDNNIETLWLYGERDWMNVKGGEYIYHNLKSNGGKTQFKVIEKAGHHIYLDNLAGFNNACIEFLNQ